MNEGIPTRGEILAKVAEGDHMARQAMNEAIMRNADVRAVLDDVHRKMEK